MNSAVRRRRDPQPIDRGWELAVAAGGGVLVVAALAALVGVGVAAAWWGGGWMWPQDTSGAVQVVGALFRGDVRAGLPAEQQDLAAAQLPTVIAVALSEILAWATVACIGLAVRRRLLPGDAQGGMATRADAEAALGSGRLRAVRGLIRPDLHRRD